MDICAISNAADMRIAAPVQEKEDWINAVGRAIVKHSRRWGAVGKGLRCAAWHDVRKRLSLLGVTTKP